MKWFIPEINVHRTVYLQSAVNKVDKLISETHADRGMFTVPHTLRT